MESRVNFLFAIIALVLMASVAMMTYRCSAPSTPKYFPKKASLEDAIAAADQAEKPVFAVFGAEWSEPSERFKKRALADDRVAAWVSSNTQPIYVDMSNSESGDAEAAALFNRYAIAEFPTVILLRKGVEVGRLEKDVSAKDLLKWLNEKATVTPGG